MRACFLPILLAQAVFGQEIDTITFRGQGTHGSLLDRAESGQERLDFLAIQKGDGPQERRVRAESFLAKYPQSWLLSSAYELGSLASLEVNDFPGALNAGRASLRLLPENAPLLVALARIEIAMGRRSDAGRDARDALLWLSVLAGPGTIKEAEWIKASRSLEESARAVIAQAGGKLPAPEEPEPPGLRLKFAGSEACKTCHQAEYESWRKTGMARMLQPIATAVILADFSQPVTFHGESGDVEIRDEGAGRPVFEFSRPGSPLRRFRADYAIGSKWQQAYATRLADGRIFVFPIQYNAMHRKWINYWATIDPPRSARADISGFPSLSIVTSYQRNCATCHTSQLQLMRLDDETMQKAAFREPGINCEMCHGPCAVHVASMSAGHAVDQRPSVPPLRFSKLDHVEATLVCGQCHRQSALRKLGSNGEMNYSRRPPWFERLLSQPYTEFGQRPFYKDGRFRETTFIGESFLRSACFRRGTAQCASCHDVHPRDAGENPTSLKFQTNPDEMCTQCHTAVAAQSVAHTHHRPESPGARCVACHMPPIMNSLLFKARSHQIDDIPTADLTARFGPAESPNACLLCHSEKDVQWMAAQLRSWKAGLAISAAKPVYP